MTNNEIWFSDPSHAWLRVSTERLSILGIRDEISTYSYVSPSRQYTFLEEDCDAGKYIRAAYGDQRMDFEERPPVAGDSHIRLYNRYQA